MGLLLKLLGYSLAIALTVYAALKVLGWAYPPVNGASIYIEGQIAYLSSGIPAFTAWAQANANQAVLLIGGSLTGLTAIVRTVTGYIGRLQAKKEEAETMLSTVSGTKDVLQAQYEELATKFTESTNTKDAVIGQLQGEVDKLTLEKDTSVTELQRQLTDLRSQNTALQKAVETMKVGQVLEKVVIK